MPIPTWTVGEVLASADVNTWFVPLVAIKPSDQSVTSSTLVVGDLALFVPLAANATYHVNAMVNYQGGTQGSSDIKWGWSVPGGSTMRYQVRCVDVATGGTILATFNGTATGAAGTNGTSNVRSVSMEGLIVVSSTAANLSFVWAQNTSNATATTVLTNSWLKAQRIA